MRLIGTFRSLSVLGLHSHHLTAVQSFKKKIHLKVKVRGSFPVSIFHCLLLFKLSAFSWDDSQTFKMQLFTTLLLFCFLARLPQKPWQSPCWRRFPRSWWTSSTPWSWSHPTPPLRHQTLQEQSDTAQTRTGSSSQPCVSRSLRLRREKGTSSFMNFFLAFECHSHKPYFHSCIAE